MPIASASGLGIVVMYCPVGVVCTLVLGIITINPNNYLKVLISSSIKNTLAHRTLRGVHAGCMASKVQCTVRTKFKCAGVGE
jgi:hypothetical protein